MRVNAGFVFIFALCAIPFVAGCGEENSIGRQAIWGKVSFKGAPLDQGQIQFEPEAESGGILNGAQIRDGAYSLEEQDGLPAGKYRVRIYSSEGGIEVDPNQAPGESTAVPMAKERIPAEFNRESSKVVEVKDDADNEFNFEIP